MDTLPDYLVANQMGACPPDQNVTNFTLRLLQNMKQAKEQDEKCRLGSDVFLASTQVCEC
jgi:hypothetical protein